MARILFSNQAKALARKLIAETPMAAPFISISWSKGIKDNHRGTNGEVLWRVIEEPGWSVILIDWDNGPARDGLHEVKIDELTVYLDELAHDNGGAFMVDAGEGGLSISHEPSQ